MYFAYISRKLYVFITKHFIVQKMYKNIVIDAWKLWTKNKGQRIFLKIF